MAGAGARLLLWLSAALILAPDSVVSSIYSSRLFHRFSEELKPLSSGERGMMGDFHWPDRKSSEYYQLMLGWDRRRQAMKLGPRRQFLFPSEGSQTMSFGNELGWLHYTWIDIGTPKVPFLVALDDGSDLLWVPCKCIQCAPLSASHYSSLDKDLNEYDPSTSSTCRNLHCSNEMCHSDANCESSADICSYNAQYYSVNTSSSGMLVEDVLHLSSSSDSASNTSLHASVVIGCGRKQSGGYLQGAAPDGLMGLGLDEISVPSILAKSGLVRNSFSLCFNSDGSGTILFGDQGTSTQRMTSFLPLDGKYKTYIVGVDSCCVGKNPCLKQTSFKALVDSGSSFTFLPLDAYKNVVKEFDRQVNATRASYDGYPWEYCYESSEQEHPEFPSLKLMLASNNNFVVHNPLFPVYGSQRLVGYCLTVQCASGDIGIIGQDFLTGYRMVFDRENMKLGWSRSDCQDLSGNEGAPASSPSSSGKSPNPLPGAESVPWSHAVAPAVAGRAPFRSSATSASTNAVLHGSLWLILSKPLVVLILFLHQWHLDRETGPLPNFVVVFIF